MIDAIEYNRQFDAFWMCYFCLVLSLSIGYTLRSRELCDLFTEYRRHEVNKKHSPETEVYNMLLLWAIFTKQRFAALETHSN